MPPNCTHIQTFDSRNLYETHTLFNTTVQKQLYKRLCKTFKGLFFEISAKPILSNTINGITVLFGLLLEYI